MNTDTGGFLSFGATWAELNVRLPGGTYQYEQTMYVESGGMVRMGEKSPIRQGLGNNAGYKPAGKYLFVLNKSFTVFSYGKKVNAVPCRSFCGAPNSLDKLYILRQNKRGKEQVCTMFARLANC